MSRTGTKYELKCLSRRRLSDTRISQEHAISVSNKSVYNEEICTEISAW